MTYNKHEHTERIARLRQQAKDGTLGDCPSLPREDVAIFAQWQKKRPATLVPFSPGEGPISCPDLGDASEEEVNLQEPLAQSAQALAGYK